MHTTRKTELPRTRFDASYKVKAVPVDNNEDMADVSCRPDSLECRYGLRVESQGKDFDIALVKPIDSPIVYEFGLLERTKLVSKLQ